MLPSSLSMNTMQSNLKSRIRKLVSILPQLPANECFHTFLPEKRAATSIKSTCERANYITIQNEIKPFQSRLGLKWKHHKKRSLQAGVKWLSRFLHEHWTATRGILMTEPFGGWKKKRTKVCKHKKTLRIHVILKLCLYLPVGDFVAWSFRSFYSFL